MVNRLPLRLLQIVATILLVTHASGAPLFAAGAPEPAAEIGAAGDPRPRRVIVLIGSGNDQPVSVDILGETFASALSRSGDHLLVRLASQSETGALQRLGGFSAAETGHLESFVRAAGADAYVWLDLQHDQAAVMRVAWRIGDALQSIEERGEYVTPLVSARELQDRAWLPLIEAATRQIPARDQAITLRLRGVPQSRILVHPGMRIELDENGETAVALRVPGDYTIQAQRAGYRTLTRQINLESATELELDQRPNPVSFVQLSLFNAQFPELALGWMPNRGQFYLGAFATFFQYGLALRERTDQNNQSDVSISLPLTHLGLSAGYLFGAQENRTRAYLGVQPFLRIATEEGVQLESNAAAGVALNLGLEYRILNNGAVFLEWNPTAYPVDREISKQEFYDGDPGTAVVTFDGLLVEMTLIRIGYRHRF